eukprot:TRINITY_DN7614_c0_g2_i1.p2 TRINITY_DN7614_c0_g2~~TRINITY_DN7614_c0_g2_i1.p2  ORF type:complete len:184 (+),score=58.93 TRINITY_DN7614_c0_g2_i1:481-1032(+)
MEIMGNARANEYYLGSGNPTPKPDKDDPQYKKQAYIRDKYEYKLWIDTKPKNNKLIKENNASTVTMSPSNHTPQRNQNKPVATKMDPNDWFDSWEPFVGATPTQNNNSDSTKKSQTPVKSPKQDDDSWIWDFSAPEDNTNNSKPANGNTTSPMYDQKKANVLSQFGSGTSNNNNNNKDNGWGW